MTKISLGITAIALAGVLWPSRAGAQGTWTTVAPMPTPRNTPAAAVIDGVLYAAGGDDNGDVSRALEAYDPATNRWTSRAPMPTARGELAGAAVGQTLYAVSGACAQGFSCITGAVEAYDSTTDTWSIRAALPTPRRLLFVGAINGIVYAVGGQDFSGVRDVVEAYDPAHDRWTTKASMPIATFYGASAVLNGILYVFGGALDVVQAYNPATNSWSTPTSMPTPRFDARAEAIGGRIYVAGGWDPSSAIRVSTVEVYDPAANAWTTAASMPTARDGMATGQIGNIMYAAGGFDGFANLGVTEAFDHALTFTAAIQPPVNPDGSSVFKANRGVVPVKFTLSLNATPTCDLPAATISLIRTAGSAVGAVNESEFIQPSDTGSSFRIDGCQYLYSVGTSSLGPGTYRVEIRIGSSVIGSGVFGLQ